jgi:hypothetical protein
MKFIGNTGKEYYVDNYNDEWLITSYIMRSDLEGKSEGTLDTLAEVRDYLLKRGCSDAAYFNRSKK